jgi:hypothetical protein
MAREWVEAAFAAPPRDVVFDWTMRHMVRVYPEELLRAYWRVDWLSRQSAIMPSHSFAPSDDEYEQIGLVMEQARHRAERADVEFREAAEKVGIDYNEIKVNVAYLWRNWNLLELI